jgi:hypothetical protein
MKPGTATMVESFKVFSPINVKQAVHVNFWAAEGKTWTAGDPNSN